MASRVPGIIAAVALIVLPIVGVALRFVQPGWLFILFLIVIPALIVAYALAVVIAITGYLTPRAAFQVSRSRARALAATWAAALSAPLASLILTDGGDGPEYGSPLTVMLGYSTPPVELENLLGPLVPILILVGILSLLWLTIEWIVALVLRSRVTPLTV